MPLKLSDEEIRKRLEKLRNYERLYPQLKTKYEKANRRIKELEQEVATLKKEYTESVETLKLQVEELRRMVFGKGKNDDGEPPAGSRKKPRSGKGNGTPREPDSYRRSTPPEEDITEENHYGIDTCPDCGEPLVHLREVVRYMEDILLRQKTVEKQRIETGFCPHCRKWHSAIPIAKQVCSLGENVRRKIVHAITVLGLTFDKVKADLRDTFGIDVSDGEIDHILTTEAAKLLPEYHAIDAHIRGSPARHCDETSWPVQKEGEGSWGWVKTASDGPATIFRIGRSRGRGNAEELCEKNGQPTVTDDYGAYDYLGEDQGLCWAHPKRKFRDLAESTSLIEEKRMHCVRFYQRFCRLYGTMQAVVESPYQREEREKAAQRLSERIGRLCRPDPADPKKLATLKATFSERREAYLLCVRLPNIPMTNNKAERAIKPLVLKRKVSFGSKTQKGADVMSILMSVCFTIWWGKPENFYGAYQEVVRKWQAA